MNINELNKVFLDEESVILDSFRLGTVVFDSGFKPTWIIGLWRGGSSVGIYVQECLQTLGIHAEHVSLRTSYRGFSYYEQMIQNPASEIRVHGSRYVVEKMNADDSLLIVDDVFSSGRNIEAVIKRLQYYMKRNFPQNTKVATLYNRPSFNEVGFGPDYFLAETNDWLVFPYELVGLSTEEIQRNKPKVAELLNGTADKK